MATINVYQQYFAAECTYNGVDRHASAVTLIATSEDGQIRYEVAVSFFPHVSDDDFAISYDAYFSKLLYEAKGRRSKKREQQLMEILHDESDSLATEANGVIFWDRPLIEARFS
jgi:hypothetical protein